MSFARNLLASSRHDETCRSFRMPHHPKSQAQRLKERQSAKTCPLFAVPKNLSSPLLTMRVRISKLERSKREKASFIRIDPRVLVFGVRTHCAPGGGVKNSRFTQSAAVPGQKWNHLIFLVVMFFSSVCLVVCLSCTS